MRKTHLLVFVYMLIYLSGCELFELSEPKPELPPITTTGQYTFGALVNGKVWEIRSRFRMRTQYRNTESIMISGSYQTKEIDQYLNIEIWNEPIEEGEYIFDKTAFPDRKLNWQDDELGQNFRGEDSDVSFNGTLNIIKLDRSKKIISGTFEFQIHKTSESTTINIGNGRFDMIYGQ